MPSNESMKFIAPSKSLPYSFTLLAASEMKSSHNPFNCYYPLRSYISTIDVNIPFSANSFNASFPK